MCLYVFLILTNLPENIKSFLSNLSGASHCHYCLPVPEQENNMKMEIVNGLLCHETEFTLPSECNISFPYGLEYTQNMLSQTCCM